MGADLYIIGTDFDSQDTHEDLNIPHTYPHTYSHAYPHTCPHTYTHPYLRASASLPLWV